MSYVLIPRISVFGANAQSAYTVVSGLSPLSYMGFARKLMINLRGGDVNQTDHIRVAILHHDIEMRGEQDYYFKPSQLRGAALTSGRNGQSNDYVSGGLSMSSQPIALCNVTASLILSGFDDFTESEIDAAARNLRIAGGHIRDFGRVRSFDSVDMAAKRSGGGYFMLERSDIMKDRQGVDKIEAMLSVMLNHSDGNGWITPMNLGFIAITPFTEKESARSSLPHAYAEPLVGMVQYKTRRSLEQEESPIPFWHYGRIGDAFVVSCN